VLALLTALLIWFGVNPAPLLDVIRRNAALPVVALQAPEPDMLSQHVGSGFIDIQPMGRSHQHR
jgi:hypothetical protein